MLELPSLLGEAQQLIFETAVRVLRDVRDRISPDAHPDEALAQVWQAVDPEWLETCLVDPSDNAAPFATACTLAEAHGYAGVLFPLGTAILGARLLRDVGVPLPVEPAQPEAGIMLTAPIPPEDDAAYWATAWCELSSERSYVTVPASWVPYARPLASHVLLWALAKSPYPQPALFAVPTTNRGLALERVPTSGGNYLCRIEPRRAAVRSVLMTGPRVAAAVQAYSTSGAVLTAAELTGIGRAALEMTLEYAKSRVQFGRPIGGFQAVHHHSADMLRDLTATRLLVGQAASRLDRGLPAEREASMAKAKAAEAIPALLRMAHQITGGVGFYRDYPLEGYLRRSIDAQAAFGNALHHRRRLARLLQQDPAAFRGPDAHSLRTETGQA